MHEDGAGALFLRLLRTVRRCYIIASGAAGGLVEDDVSVGVEER